MGGEWPAARSAPRYPGGWGQEAKLLYHKTRVGVGKDANSAGIREPQRLRN